MEITFSSNLQYAKLQNFLHIRLNRSGPSSETKISKFLPFNFSQYNFEKLIRTPKDDEFIAKNFEEISKLKQVSK